MMWMQTQTTMTAATRWVGVKDDIRVWELAAGAGFSQNTDNVDADADDDDDSSDEVGVETHIRQVKGFRVWEGVAGVGVESGRIRRQRQQ